MQALLLKAVQAGLMRMAYERCTAVVKTLLLAAEVAVLQALAGMLMEQGLLALHRKQMGGFGAGGRAGAFSAIAITAQVATPPARCTSSGCGAACGQPRYGMQQVEAVAF